MREPEPTPADQWSRWETEPDVPGYWPGLGAEHHTGGFEIDRRGVKAVAGKLVDAAIDVSKFAHLHHAGPFVYGEMHWALPRELGRQLGYATTTVAHFWADLHAEIGMAGLLIERACTRYDLADKPKLGDIPLGRLDDRLVGMIPGDAPSSVLPALSTLYPNGGISLELPGSIDYGVGNMTAARVKEDLTALPYGDGSGPGPYDQMPESLVELANKLMGRAQDLRDAPWYGEAADMAQTALRQIYANATALAALTAGLNTATLRFEQVAHWCRENFQRLADPDRGGWDEFWDLGGTADSRTGSFLAKANEELFDVYRLMPKRIKQDLPGLMVTDESLAEFRLRVRNVETRPKDSEWLADNDRGWLETHRPVLRGQELAEETYG
ncbi:hypothetical protein [Nonomuraea sp. SBT364]|uniref:hypothetical protein n=1 Tax=Nonomuraea sp. SBT364 TaxID=1580530 RepID=UPI00066C1E86|nr:hypothetical protein [Nonomuraea sp. SBT364]